MVVIKSLLYGLLRLGGRARMGWQGLGGSGTCLAVTQAFRSGHLSNTEIHYLSGMRECPKVYKQIAIMIAVSIYLYI